MENSPDLNIQPDKYTYNTVLHCYAKAGGTESASKARQLLASMERKYQEGNVMAKPDTITVRLVRCTANGFVAILTHTISSRVFSLLQT